LPIYLADLTKYFDLSKLLCLAIRAVPGANAPQALYDGCHFDDRLLPAVPVLRVDEMDALVGRTALTRDQVEAQIVASRHRVQTPLPQRVTAGVPQ